MNHDENEIGNYTEIEWQALDDMAEIRITKGFLQGLLDAHNRLVDKNAAVTAYLLNVAAHVNDLIIRVGTLEMQRDAENFLEEQANVNPIDLEERDVDDE